MEEELVGSIERITYFNDDNGYSVIRIIAEQSYPNAEDVDGTITVVGIMPELVVGESAKFSGKWANDPIYGRQFKTQNVIPIMPGSEEGIIRYLSSGIVRGIGPKTAGRIVSYFGEDTLEILDNDPQKIYEVPSLKPILAENLLEAWATNRIKRQTLIYLQGLGITSRFATKIYDEYGKDTIHTLKSDPYRLADEMFGIGFKKADTVAKGMGVELNSRERIRSGIHYALNQLARDGHTFAPLEELVEKTQELLEIDETSKITASIKAQIVANKLRSQVLNYADGEQVEAIYLPLYYYSEVGCADRLKTIANSPSKILNDERVQDYHEFLNQITDKNNVTLTEQQQDAVQAALEQKVTVLTGGPGTGKTTTLQMVIHAIEEMDYQYALASPTGRAAKRLSEATERPATTIHRLLGFSPFDGFMYGEDNPLEIDFLIVDEASMIDLTLFYSLLKALQPITHLMLVGDVDQLPSVGAGNVLRDVIESEIAHVTVLDQIFRQDDESHIVINAHRINEGEMPFTDNQSNDFFFFKIENVDSVGKMVVDIVKNRLPSKFNVDPVDEVQVIAPMYRGPAGVNALNTALQETLNGSQSKAQKKFGNTIFRVGDKVMQTKNNYEKEVFNGDIGRIHGIDFEDNSVEVVIDERFIYYDFTDMDQLIHAYCISTHRSQGSEYPIVVMPLVKQHYMMLQRNLVYTAITRAKKVVVLVGDRRALFMAVNNNKVAERFSGLAPRLQG